MSLAREHPVGEGLDNLGTLGHIKPSEQKLSAYKISWRATNSCMNCSICRHFSGKYYKGWSKHTRNHFLSTQLVINEKAFLLGKNEDVTLFDNIMSRDPMNTLILSSKLLHPSL